ncbi:HD domain-containing protein [bacterium]|nr:HD domain-containing protein [bacterium]
MQNPLPGELYHSRVQPRRPDIRGDYFRDQTAIIHSSPFRRLKHKTQVFFSPKNDHICTRIEHVLHVSTIATTICKGLDLDVELAQAIALGHDLGHAPFGHIGERVLDELAGPTGGFIHEVHSLRVVDKITRGGKGLNLTYAVRDGIVSHCGEIFMKSIAPETSAKTLESISARQSAPLTYEACVVRVADKIAYLGRDIEDAITAGLIQARDVPDNIRKNLGSTNGEIIDTLVMDVIRESGGTDAISFSEARFGLICELKDFNYQRIYNHPQILKSDASIRSLISHLFMHLMELYRKNGTDFPAYRGTQQQIDRDFGEFIANRRKLYAAEPYPESCVSDFVAGMTDSYALESANELLFPKPVGR